MRGKALERAVAAEKVLPKDLDERVRKVRAVGHLEGNTHAHQVLGLVKRGISSGIPFDGPEEYVDTPELRSLLRTAAADSIVLLKNENGVLPLKSPKKIAVIGPNAKAAMLSGGGSAMLLASYAVSPLQGIVNAATAVGADVKYALGTTSHKFLPLVNPYMRLEGGQNGALIEFWNAAPSSDFVSSSPDFTTPLLNPTWTTRTCESYAFLVDNIVSSGALF